MIKLSNLLIEYQNRRILYIDTFCAKKAEITIIKGLSGSGKTSFLYALGLISSFSNYFYRFDGKSIDVKKESEKAIIRKQIGYIFQDSNLIEELTIKEQFFLYAGINSEQITVEEIKDLLKYVNLNKSIDGAIETLSSGERQRLCIALTLAKNPNIIIADEPTSSLDKENQELIITIFRKIAYDLQKIVVIASHSSEVTAIGDRCYLIENNQLLLNKESTHQITFPKQELIYGKKKIAATFFKFIYKQISHFNRYKELILLLIVSILTVAGLFLDNYFRFQKESVNAQIEIHQYSKLPLTFQDIEAIKKNQQVNSIHSMDSYVQLHNQNFNLVVSLLPDKEINTTNFIYFNNNIENGGIILNASLAKEIGLISNDFVINDFVDNHLDVTISGTYYNLKIIGIIQDNTKVKDQNFMLYILENDELLSELEVTYLLTVGLNIDVTSLKENIGTISPEILINGNTINHLLSQKKYNELINTFITISLLIFYVVIISYFSFIMLLRILQQEHVLCMLKANGLNKYEFIRILFYQLRFQLLFSVTVSIILFLFVSVLGYHLLGVPFRVISIITIICILLVTLVPVQCIVFNKIIKIDVERYLRN